MDWSCNSRANVNYETLKIMKDCGLRLLLVGYESGNQEILNRVKKGITVEEAKQFTKHCKDLGITIHGTFILGLPVETRETIEETIRYAIDLDVFSNSSLAGGALSRHRIIRDGSAEWLVCQEG